MTKKHKAFVSKELETLTQELNKEIKLLENTLQEKYNNQKSLIKLNIDAMNLFQIDFNLPGVVLKF